MADHTWFGLAWADSLSSQPFIYLFLFCLFLSPLVVSCSEALWDLKSRLVLFCLESISRLLHLYV